MMHMTFYWSREVTILVKSWHTDSWGSYSLSLLACVIAAAFYQYLEHVRFRLRLWGKTAKTAERLEEPLLQQKGAGVGAGRKWSPARLLGGVVFGINSALGYLLMLAVMSFNGGVFLAIVFGLAVGYLAFRGEEDDAPSGVDNPCACA